jgi:ATP-binding cassette subfamily B (MDR/TAP) protein 1
VINNLNASEEEMQRKINRICILFCYVGCGALAGGFLQVSCWTFAGERQSHKLRSKYILAVLSQEIGWFDEVGASELGTKVIELTDTIQGNYIYASQQMESVVRWETCFSMFSK